MLALQKPKQMIFLSRWDKMIEKKGIDLKKWSCVTLLQVCLFHSKKNLEHFLSNSKDGSSHQLVGSIPHCPGLHAFQNEFHILIHHATERVFHLSVSNELKPWDISYFCLFVLHVGVWLVSGVKSRGWRQNFFQFEVWWSSEWASNVLTVSSLDLKSYFSNFTITEFPP